MTITSEKEIERVLNQNIAIRVHLFSIFSKKIPSKEFLELANRLA